MQDMIIGEGGGVVNAWNVIQEFNYKIHGGEKKPNCEGVKEIYYFKIFTNFTLS